MEKTKVFISWSGARSRAVAKLLRHYLPRVIQPVDPWLSESDLEKGSQWFSEVMTAMKPCRFAIVCLTPENLLSTWLHWEAGAIAMNFESRICTYLFGALRFSDVQPPLNQFQHNEGSNTFFNRNNQQTPVAFIRACCNQRHI
jgi:TIR domain